MIELLGFKMEVTFGSIGTILCTVLQGRGAWMQGKRIWSDKSGESVSVPLFAYITCYIMSFFVYAWHKREIPMLFNAFLLFLYLPITIGLYKFKGFSNKEKLLSFAFVAMIPVMVFCPNKDVVFMGALFGILIFSIFQIVEIKRTGTVGAIEPEFIVIGMATSIFWFMYAMSIGNIPLLIFNPVAFYLNAFILRLWLKAKGAIL